MAKRGKSGKSGKGGSVSAEPVALVTGGAGLLGSHVVRQLVTGGVRVRVLYRPGSDVRNLCGVDVQWVPGDVADASAVKSAVAGCDRVFHVHEVSAPWVLPSSPDSERARAAAAVADGTDNVLRAAADAGVSRVVYTSSIAVFGGQGPGQDATEDSPFRLGATGDVSAQAQYEAHQVALGWAERGLDLVLVAPTAPIGPGDVGPSPVGRMLLSAVELPIPIVVDTCGNVIDVRDCAAAYLRAAERGVAGQTYILGHENISPKALIHIVAEVLGARRPVLRVPHGAVAGLARGLSWVDERIAGVAPVVTPAAVDIARLGLRARADKARRELGLTGRPVADSVRDALRWFARHGYIRSPRARRRLLAR